MHKAVKVQKVQLGLQGGQETQGRQVHPGLQVDPALLDFLGHQVLSDQLERLGLLGLLDQLG